MKSDGDAHSLISKLLKHLRFGSSWDLLQTHQGALIPVAGKSIRSSRNLHGVFVEAQLTGRRRSRRALLHASASNLHVGKVAKKMCKGKQSLFLAFLSFLNGIKETIELREARLMCCRISPCFLFSWLMLARFIWWAWVWWGECLKWCKLI